MIRNGTDGAKNETARLDCTYRASGEGEHDHPSITGCHAATGKTPIGGSVAENIPRFRKKGSRFSKLHTFATWNVRRMSQGRLDTVKSEMGRTVTDILGISELRWKGMGFFILDEYTVYYSGKEKFKENGVSIILNRKIVGTVLGYKPVRDRIISLRIQGYPVNYSILQVYSPTFDAEDQDIQDFVISYNK